MFDKKEIDFEELGAPRHIKSEDFLELRLSSKIAGIIFVLFVVFQIFVFGLIAKIAVFGGSFYKARAMANMSDKIDIAAPRGIILDRLERPLLENAINFSLELSLNEFFKIQNKNEFLKTLSGLIDRDINELVDQISKVDIAHKNSLILAPSLSKEKVIDLRAKNLPALLIRENYTRNYFDSKAFANILGFIGYSDKDDELSGRAGIEFYYDEILSGKDGSEMLIKDTKGEILDKKATDEPIPGENIALTIDYDLQKYFYERLAAGLESLGRYIGAGIALDPKSGEILALVGMPSYDNNAFSKFTPERSAYLTDKNKPFFNRIISGLYSPGSTIKPLVALAALSEGVITPKKEIFSSGSIEIPNPYFPDKPSRFLDWKAHGWVNLYSALARSSNVYFYYIGGGYEDFDGLGVNRLYKYWQNFGLDRKTGIDFPGENSGFLPNPEFMEGRGKNWLLGDTYNVSIGQGDLLITPLELLNIYSFLANKGVVYKPHFNKDSTAEIILENRDFQKEINEVEKGLADATQKWYGTASLLMDLPIVTAAKTGTTQVQDNEKLNAFFVGYAPVKDPQILILVLIEDAKEGSLNVVPIARDVLEWYYYNRIIAN